MKIYNLLGICLKVLDFKIKRHYEALTISREAEIDINKNKIENHQDEMCERETYTPTFPNKEISSQKETIRRETKSSSNVPKSTSADVPLSKLMNVVKKNLWTNIETTFKGLFGGSDAKKSVDEEPWTEDNSVDTDQSEEEVEFGNECVICQEQRHNYKPVTSLCTDLQKIVASHYNILRFSTLDYCVLYSTVLCNNTVKYHI